ncbi:MAG: gntR [Phycisphaerales bacterium]|jgi:DNA-binding transcriptional MocR family regulator|nr:gntR [Phycisphaerales bacterium]
MRSTREKPQPARSKGLDDKLYVALAERLAALIDAGTLAVGERIPSVRRLSEQFKVAPGTVLHAYRLLEDQGRIRARPQSGFYVCPTRQPLPEPRSSTPGPRASSPTVGDLVMRMSEMSAAEDVVPLGHAIPNAACLPTQQLNRLSAAISRRTSRGFNYYDVPPGCRELRVQVAKHYIAAGCGLSPDDIVTTSGCQEAIGLCLRAAVEPGGVVVVDSPTYYGILQAIEMLGMRAIEVPTSPRVGVDLEVLERTLSTRKVAACLFVTNCHNPLGFVMPEDRKRKLVHLLARHDVPLIEDDTYGDLAYGDQRPSVCKAFDAHGRVMLCSSFSKTLAPGARVGWCAPGRYLEKVKRLKFCNTIATATLPQLTIAEYLAAGGYAHQLRKMRRIYRDQVHQLSQAVQRNFPPGTRATRPAGGHVLWVELPSGTDSMELFDRAADAKISIAPGPLFSTKGDYRNFIRLNCSVPGDAQLERAIQTLGAFAEDLSRAPTAKVRSA